MFAMTDHRRGLAINHRRELAINHRWELAINHRRELAINLCLRRTAFILVIVAAFTALAPVSRAAEERRIFEVRGVAVDITAGSTAAARDKARAYGEKTAFKRLLERLTLSIDAPRLPNFSNEQIAPFVQDFEVAEEKASAVRYLATLNYRFKPADMRRLMIDLSIPFAETTSKPVLVLPVFQAAGTLLLWDEPNPWREAWKQRPPQFSLVPTLLPKGDLSDIANIGPEQAVAGDAPRLAAIAGRYRAGDTLVAQAILNTDRVRPEVEVYVTRYGTAQQEQTTVKSFAANDGESLDALLLRAAVDLTRSIEDNWKRDNVLQFDRHAVVAVKIRIKSLQDWIEIRRRLGGVAVIRKTDLVILSLGEARVNLNYIGQPEQLALALEQADMIISREEEDWVLALKSASGG